MKISNKKLLFSGFLSLIFLYFLIKSLGDLDLVHVLSILKPTYLLLAFLCYLVVAAARSFRIQTVFSEEKYPPFLLFAVSNVHTFVSNVFPSRLGELSFIYFMRQIFGQRVSKNTVVLIFVRIMDTFVVTSFFLIASFVVGLSKIRPDYLWLYLFLVLFFGLVSFYLDMLVVVGVTLVKSLMSFLTTNAWSEKLNRFLDSLSEIKILRRRGVYWRSLILTLVIWTFLMLANKAMTMAMGLDLSLPVLFFASTGAVLTGLIPVTTFAAVGTYELGWIGTFALMGLPKEQAILTGLTIHAINFFYSLILGGVGFIVIRMRKTK